MTGKEDVTYRKQDFKVSFFFYIYANYMSENVVFMILILRLALLASRS